MTGPLTLAGNPSADLHASPKQYVDLREPIGSMEVTRWDFFERANGAIGISDSGHSYTVSGSLGALPVVSNGKMVSSQEGTAFAQLDCGVAPVQYGAKFTFEAGTDNGTFMIGSSKEADLSITDQLHFLLKVEGWNFQYRVASGAFLSLGQANFVTPLLDDGVTEYELVIEIRGNTASVQLPDDTTISITNSVIGDLHGRYVIWEPTKAAGQAEPRFTSIWAATPATVRPTSPYGSKGWVATLISKLTDTTRRIVANKGETTQAVIGREATTGFAGISLGAAEDASIYRGAANDLRTAGNWRVQAGAANQVLMGSISGGGGFLFGSASDTALRRTAADTLQMGTGDHFKLDGTWNGGRLQLGAYHLWVDATGALRIKSSAPTSDLDGTVVGVQT